MAEPDLHRCHTGEWKPELEHEEYVQVDLGRIQPISRVETKGFDNEWVKSYTLAYSENGKQFFFIIDYDGSRKIFDGNMDSVEVVTNTFGPYPARFVRLYPIDFYGRATIQWEISYTGTCRNYTCSNNSTML